MNLQNLFALDKTKYRPIPFWSWNDKLEEADLRRQIGNMQKCGIGGFFMHARGGLMTDYLSDDWFEATRVCIDEAQKRGMHAWCYDENGWPSGFAGMKLLEDNANHCHYITCETKNEFDSDALAVYVLENGTLRRVFSGENGEFICVFDKTNSSVVDILNPDIVRKFIDETHEKYYARFKESFGNVMMGFFTDEPQYFRWDTAYTPVILEEYKKAYGDDLLDTLGALFVDCENAYETRFRYWKLMNKLFTESFAKQIYDWCDEHGCMLTGHAVEESTLYGQMWCCAGIMPFYEYEHIPGVDWLGRNISTELTPRQVFSACQQLGKKQVLTETFALAGWDVTPKQLKRIAQWQYVNGVNLMCHHLYPYSIRGQRKRDYPAFYSEHNTWTKPELDVFRAFNDYFTHLGMMLAESREHSPIGVIHPIHSAYLTYNRALDRKSIETLEKELQALVETLGAMNIGHHYIDETMLEKHGNVEGDTLKVGLCSYSKIVIPYTQCLDSSTVILLKKYVENGGKVYLYKGIPQYCDGKKADLSFLESALTVDELCDDELKISDINTDIRSTLRRSEYGDFIYAVNISEDKAYDVTFTVKAGSAELFDLETMTKLPAVYSKNGDYISIPLSFEATRSYVILLDTGAPSATAAPALPVMKCAGDFKVVSSTENALTVDTASYSFDGESYSEPVPVMAISDMLLRRRVNGPLHLKYTFNVKQLPKSIFLEAEGRERLCAPITVNGNAITDFTDGAVDKKFLRCDIAPFVQLGENTVIIHINYEQTDDVYNIFNGVYYEHSDGTESLINCLSYCTDIEAIYILGDFGVYSDSFRKKKGIVCESDGDFYIADAKTKINGESIIENGYLFFAGQLTLEKQFESDGNPFTLSLDGHYASAHVELNGEKKATLIFDNKCVITGAKKGNNTLRITLTNGSRNLFGPFHCAHSDEPTAVAPNTFSRYGTWDNFQSPRYRDSYTFTEFGLY